MAYVTTVLQGEKHIKVVGIAPGQSASKQSQFLFCSPGVLYK